MRVLFIASECVPFAKTGGLADVVGSLPQALTELGHEVIVVMPLYPSALNADYPLTTKFTRMGVSMGQGQEWCAIKLTKVGDVTVYFIEFNLYFDRPGIYHDDNFQDYTDNPKRFAFLSRAALQLCIDTKFVPDIVHVHDWQTSLAPAYLKVWFWDHPMLGGAASVLTIHNIGYQGRYPTDHWSYIGMHDHMLNSEQFEDHGAMNLLKGGIAFADHVTTVSPTYAAETRHTNLGHGLSPYLQNKGDRFDGILNGVDYTQWNPENDKLIPANYSAESLEGKTECKFALQRRMSLDPRRDIPIVGVVSRFVHQKGLDLLASSIEEIVHRMGVQFAILGSGDQSLESSFQNAAARNPGQIGCVIGYDNHLAHLIEAGSDFFLMPSRYEPCGLNQLYSLRYGTLPIVRATGGLVDTVEQYDEATGKGTGFLFYDTTPQAVHDTVGWAVSTYYDRQHHFLSMQTRAMSRNFSWRQSALHYENVYQRALAHHRSW